MRPLRPPAERCPKSAGRSDGCSGLQIAIAHHRFVWIHPFRNGNGRVARLFTYAMLRKAIFATRGYSAVNPTAVFGNNRDAYISALERADELTDAGTIAWAEFFVPPNEAAALRTTLELGVVKAGDLEHVIAGSAAQRSRSIRALLDQALLQHADEGPRFYRLSLSRGPLAPRLGRRLDTLGDLPKMLADD